MPDVEFERLAQFQPKQMLAWETLCRQDCTYLLYGGAMHGGKSYFLRWAALGLVMYFGGRAGHAGVTVGLFSEDYPTLKDRQISKIVQEFPPTVGELKTTETEGLCFFVKPEFGGGRILLRNLDDPSKYMSSEFAAILVEELTKNPLDTFTSLRTRLRYPGINNAKFVGATNPGGVGHVWCKKYWITKNSGDKEQRLFHYVPATLDDNKFTTDAYRAKVDALPDRLRRAYKFGDWDAFEGQFFSTFDQLEQVIEPFVIDDNWELVGSLDPGWGGPLSFGLQARDFVGTEYRIGTYYVAEKNAEDHALAINEFINTNKFTSGRQPNMIVAGHDAWARKDRYAIQANDKTMAGVFLEHGIFLLRAQIDRPNGWGALKAAMPKHYKIFKYFNEELVEQLTQTLTDERRVFDIQGCGNDPNVPDHALDDARYGHMALWQPTDRRVEEPVYKTSHERMVREVMDKITDRPRRNPNL